MLECGVDSCSAESVTFILAASLQTGMPTQSVPLCEIHAVELGKFLTALMH